MKIHKEWSNSSQLLSAEYDNETKILTVTFLKGSVYEYFEVSKINADKLFSADSAGKAFNILIRNRYLYAKIS